MHFNTLQYLVSCQGLGSKSELSLLHWNTFIGLFPVIHMGLLGR